MKEQYIMKILYHSPDPRMSLSDSCGYSTHITELIRAFKLIGNDVREIIAGLPSDQKIKFPKKSAIRRILSGRIIETARIVSDVFYDCKSYLEVKSTILEFIPDFIYERYVVFHQSGAVLSKKYDVPIIFEVNSPISERNVHYGSRRRTVAQGIEKKIIKSANAIVVVSKILRNYLIDLGIEDSKIHIIPNAVDCNRFNPQTNGELIKIKYGLKDKKVIGIIGGFGNWHGIDSLLLAAHDIITKNKNVHFLLVGKGPMRSFSESIVKNRGISDYVTFTGSVLYKDIPQYIAAMDIATMPSSNSYGSPIKIFEYMAMRKPIVAPKVGPVEEIIDDGQEGLLVKPGNKGQLRDAILHLLDSEAFACQMAKNARQKVLKNFTWKKNAERIIQIFLSLK